MAQGATRSVSKGRRTWLLRPRARDQARKHLATADSLLGARPAGLLAALAAVAHMPDPRLNALDPVTGHELVALRAEAEKALAGK